jgi:protein-S-isoprenylcysteine O-methyltransferase Ste14
MDSRLVFKIAFLVLFTTLLMIRAVFGIRQCRMGESSWSVDQEAVEREGLLSLVLRPIGFLVLLGLFAIYIIEPPGSDWLFLPLPAWVGWMGALLSASSIVLLAWVHRTLGSQWSTTLQFKEKHALVTSGPYAYIRHPMYTALILTFLGLSLVSALWPFMALLAILILFFVRIVEREESMMVEQFGEEYRAYMKRTGRYLPKVRGDL